MYVFTCIYYKYFIINITKKLNYVEHVQRGDGRRGASLQELLSTVVSATSHARQERTCCNPSPADVTTTSPLPLPDDGFPVKRR